MDGPYRRVDGWTNDGWAVLAGGQQDLADTFKDQINADLLTFLKA